MSKKKRKAGKGRAGNRPAQVKKSLRWAKAAVIAPLVLCVIAAGAASLKWAMVRHAVGLASVTEPAAQATPTPLQLSKEYVYAGGRLVATEEPTPVPSGPPPTSLIATASVPTPGPLSVSLTWSAPASGGTVTNYVVERAQTRDNTGLQFMPLSPPATSLPTPQNPYLDQSASPGVVYVYRVMANFVGGGTSGYSNLDVATTVSYTGDDPLVGANHQPGQQASVVSALNLTELQGVVDSVRALAGLGRAAWKSD